MTVRTWRRLHVGSEFAETTVVDLQVEEWEDGTARAPGDSTLYGDALIARAAADAAFHEAHPQHTCSVLCTGWTTFRGLAVHRVH